MTRCVIPSPCDAKFHHPTRVASQDRARSALLSVDDFLGDGAPEAGAAHQVDVPSPKPRGTARRCAPARARECRAPYRSRSRWKWPLTALAFTRTSPVSVNLMAFPTRLSSTWSGAAHHRRSLMIRGYVLSWARGPRLVSVGQPAITNSHCAGSSLGHGLMRRCL